MSVCGALCSSIESTRDAQKERGMAKAMFHLPLFTTVKPLRACFISGTGQVFHEEVCKKIPLYMYYLNISMHTSRHKHMHIYDRRTVSSPPFHAPRRLITCSHVVRCTFVRFQLLLNSLCIAPVIYYNRFTALQSVTEIWI